MFLPAESLTVFLAFAASTILSPFHVLGGSLEEAAEEVGKEFKTYKLMDPLESGPAWSYKDHSRRGGGGGVGVGRAFGPESSSRGLCLQSG